MDLSPIIHDGAFELFCGQVLEIPAGSRCEKPFLLTDPVKTTVRVGEGAEAEIALLHAAPVSAALRVEVAPRARLSVAQCFTAEAFVELTIVQAEGSFCRITSIELASANNHCTVDLAGAGSENELDGLFLASGEEHCVFDLRVNHRAADCHSRSLVKGVAAGSAVGEFRGLVYVAQDAQRTDARQTSRNLQLSSGARIVTKPQLEIYADDVKCSHGATVGQMESEAVCYMRQRGLSERQARRLQIEGFAGDVVMRCPVEPFCHAMARALNEKMELL